MTRKKPYNHNFGGLSMTRAIVYYKRCFGMDQHELLKPFQRSDNGVLQWIKTLATISTSILKHDLTHLGFLVLSLFFSVLIVIVLYWCIRLLKNAQNKMRQSVIAKDYSQISRKRSTEHKIANENSRF